jgi:hypothetical protein
VKSACSATEMLQFTSAADAGSEGELAPADVVVEVEVAPVLAKTWRVAQATVIPTVSIDRPTTYAERCSIDRVEEVLQNRATNQV